MVKNLPANAGNVGLIPGLGRSPGGENSNPFLPRESHGQRRLVGYSPWSRRELDMTEHSHTHQWLRLCTPNAGHLGLIPYAGTKRLKIRCVTTKI